ncbi:TPA: ANR family transcriptional regulator [Vibrio parahaemolyticus]
MSYITLAKEASQAEQESNWKKGMELWREAIEKVARGNINYAWAIARMEFCQKREQMEPLKKHRLSL